MLTTPLISYSLLSSRLICTWSTCRFTSQQVLASMPGISTNCSNGTESVCISIGQPSSSTIFTQFTCNTPDTIIPVSAFFICAIAACVFVPHILKILFLLFSLYNCSKIRHFVSFFIRRLHTFTFSNAGFTGHDTLYMSLSTSTVSSLQTFPSTASAASIESCLSSPS